MIVALVTMLFLFASMPHVAHLKINESITVGTTNPEASIQGHSGDDEGGRSLHILPLLYKKLLISKLLKIGFLWKYALFQYHLQSTTGKPTNSTGPPTTAVECRISNDMIILIDSSGSVHSYFDIELKFAADLAVAWKKHSGNRVGIILFSSSVHSVFNIEESRSMTEDEIRKAILNAEFLGDGTSIHEGIHAATDDFILFNHTFTGEDEVPLNLVAITDGNSNLDQTQLAAHRFFQLPRANGFAVGVGVGVNAHELLAITGGKQDRLFKIKSFEDLLESLRAVSKAVCMIP